MAVNGTCLTATTVSPSGFTADVMPETLARSSLAKAARGTRVNLERALPADGRFGGHIVAGHIDGTGTVTDVRRDANAVWFTIEAPADVMRLVVEKGSIAIDGISLTVARVDDAGFAVSVIPHTLDVTVLGQRHAGDVVNLETDVVGKYVAHLLGRDFAPSASAPVVPNKHGPQGTGSPAPAGITRDFLARHGF